MGKRSNLPRNARDFYSTPMKAVLPLLEYFTDREDVNFIEPCVGDGRLVGHIVNNSDAVCTYASDIQPLPRLNGVPTELVFHQHDFDVDWETIARETEASHFITNPPFLNTKVSDFQLLRLIDKFSKVLPTVLLLPADFAFNIRSSEVMRYATEIIPIGRVKWVDDSKFSSTENFAWFRFDQKQPNAIGPVIHPRRKV